MNYAIQYIFIALFISMASSNLAQAEPSPHANEQLEVTADPSKIAADAAEPSVDEPNAPKRLTLVLGGGGCRALAEIGILKVFAKNHIPINYIVGTSAGAIIGALYAANVPLEDIEQMAYSGKLQRAVTPNVTLSVLTYPFFRFLYLFIPKPYAGLTTSAKLEKFLHTKLPDDFKDLKIPFAAVATDLGSGNTCMISSGNLCKAVAASSALPLLVRPVTIDNLIFIDGGIKANLPTNCAQLTAADIMIAVPADSPIRNEQKRKFCSMRALGMRVADIMEAEIDKYRWKEADLVIYPKIDMPMFTTNEADIKRGIASGEDAANAALPRLQELLKKKKTIVKTKP